MASEHSSHTQHSQSDRHAQGCPPEGAPIFLLPDEQRAYDAIVKDYKVLKVPDYFIDEWVPLLNAAEGWLALAFRQLAFVVRSKESVGAMPARATLRDLAKWSGLTFQHVGKVLKRAEHLHWFVRRQDGAALGEHPGSRSIAPTYLVRIEVPLTPSDQTRLDSYLQDNLPGDDEGWLRLLHRAISAKKASLPDGCKLPQEPKTIEDIVRELRAPSEQLSTELELACVELHNRWVTTNFRQVTHYFIKRFLPELTPSLAFLIVWARKHAQREDTQYPTGELRPSGWSSLAQPVGVAPYTVSRWLSDQASYPYSSMFFTAIHEMWAGEGEVDDINDASVLVSGTSVVVDPTTEIDEPIYMGDRIAFSALKALDAPDDSALVARRIRPLQETRGTDVLQKDGLLLQVRISEPIHPEDLERYERLRSSQDTKAVSRGLTRSDKLFTNGDNQPTKDDDIETQSDKPISELDRAPAKSDLSSTEGDASATESDIPPTDGDALRDSIRHLQDSNLQKETDKRLLQEHNVSQSTGSQHSRFSHAAVAVSSSWDVSQILIEGAIKRSDRKMIESRWEELRDTFVAWLLWSLATKTIEAPVLHAVSKVKAAEPPPGAFLELARIPGEKLWSWLRRDAYSIPRDHYDAVRLLRGREADQALLRLGFNPPELVAGEGELGVSGDELMGAAPEMEGKGDGCDTVIAGRTAREVWAAALGQLQAEIPRAAFDTWLRDAELVRYRQGVFEAGVRNAYARDWLDDRLSSTINRVLMGITGKTASVKFVVE